LSKQTTDSKRWRKRISIIPTSSSSILNYRGLPGFEAAVRLRRSVETRDIPLIAATGYSHATQLNQARASGFDAIVIKPCEPALLVREIERLLQKVREAKLEAV
jgi:CheY-like chemotaxis protein